MGVCVGRGGVGVWERGVCGERGGGCVCGEGGVGVCVGREGWGGCVCGEGGWVCVCVHACMHVCVYVNRGRVGVHRMC